MNIMVLGFVATVLGGVGSSKGALTGGILVGVIESWLAGICPVPRSTGLPLLF